MYTIDCKEINKNFETGGGAVEVLSRLDLQVGENEKVALLGVSGSGKSTLLHILGGLEKADGGEVNVCGKELSNLNESALCVFRSRRIGFIYQMHHLLPEFTALENVALPLLIGRRSDETSENAFERANTLLKHVGLAERASHKPHALSGGERQRVAVCRALVAEPQLILADEPTGNLDKGNAASTIDMLFELNESATLVIATHDLSIVERFEHVYRLEQGHLQAL